MGKGVDKQKAEQEPACDVSHVIDNIDLAGGVFSLKEGPGYGQHRATNKTVGNKDRGAGDNSRGETRHFTSYPKERKAPDGCNL